MTEEKQTKCKLTFKQIHGQRILCMLIYAVSVFHVPGSESFSLVVVTSHEVLFSWKDPQDSTLTVPNSEKAGSAACSRKWETVHVFLLLFFWWLCHPDLPGRILFTPNGRKLHLLKELAMFQYSWSSFRIKLHFSAWFKNTWIFTFSVGTCENVYFLFTLHFAHFPWTKLQFFVMVRFVRKS